MKNPGKIFEEDFKNSIEKIMNVTRLPDPGQSFNHACRGCEKQKTRFSPQNICDFICYKYPYSYLFELKSHKGKSIPFKAIVTKEKDKRLDRMVAATMNTGISAYIIFNWRDCDNRTFAVQAHHVQNYIQTEQKRKSIPFAWSAGIGIEIPSTLKRVRYKYDITPIFPAFISA